MTRFIQTGMLLALVLARASAAELPRHSPVPGGIAVVPVTTSNSSARPVAHYGDKRIMVVGDAAGWYAIVGIPLDAKPGEHALVVGTSDPLQRVGFVIEPKEYEVQRLTIQNKRMVEPSAQDLKRIEKESKVIIAALQQFTETSNVPLIFTPPVDGALSSTFGLRRFFNDQERKPHSGLDLAAPRGTPIHAPAAGEVIAVGNFFFNGNTVFLDHGQGLVSMYSHMDRIDVKKGQRLGKGARLGTVGMTGRVTGPHLHWTVSLNDSRIDPMLLFNEQTIAQLTGTSDGATGDAGVSGAE
jgi:murein DD-endopeptidase MepM/ murein hydrolase activator NlpD